MYGWLALEFLKESNSSFSPYLADVDMTLSPNARHTEMKARAAQNFKGGSFSMEAEKCLVIKPSSEFNIGAGDYTVECWVKINGYNNNYGISNNDVFRIISYASKKNSDEALLLYQLY